MPESIIRDVSDTALMVAVYRAIETRRPDALFLDPLAEKLGGERGKKIAESMPVNFVGGRAIVIRTVIIDNFIEAAINDGVDAILNLGAGLDTRPYRMNLPPSLQWIEVDFPHLLDYKENLLAAEKPRCRFERVRLDLADTEARRALFSKINSRFRKILVLTEGVIPYLTPEQVGALADDLRSLKNFKHWIVDYFSPETMRYRPNRSLKNVFFQFFPDKEWFDFFDEHGWKLNEIRYITDEARRLNRPMPLPLSLKLRMMIGRILGSQSLRDKKKKFNGYAILEPNA